MSGRIIELSASLVEGVYDVLEEKYPGLTIAMFGLVALSGVVVNDSLVLIDASNRVRAAGNNAHDAIVVPARYLIAEDVRGLVSRES